MPWELLPGFPAVWRTPSVFEFVLIASGHYRKESGSILYVVSLQVFTRISEISMSPL